MGIDNPAYTKGNRQSGYGAKSNDIEYVDRLRRKAREQKLAYEQKWFHVGALLLGFQNLRFDGHSGKWYLDRRVPSWRRRVVSNRMLTIYLRDKSRMTSGTPYMDLIPASDQPDDIKKAEYSQKLLEYAWQDGVLGMEQLTEEWVGWALRCGTGILKVEWDSEIGPEILNYREAPVIQMQPQVDDTGMPVIDPITGMPRMIEATTGETEIVRDTDGNPIIDSRFRLGDVSGKIIPAFDFFVDDRFQHHQDAPQCMHYPIRRIEEIRQKYPEAWDINPPERLPIEKIYSERMRELSSRLTEQLIYGKGVIDKDINRDKNNEGFVSVQEVWEKPSEKFPDGRVLVVCEDKVLYEEKNPYDHKQYPFIVYKDIPWDGRFWGMSTQQHLIGLQESYNRSRSMEEEDANLTANPMIIYYTSSKVNKSELVNRPGALVNCIMPGYEPKYLERSRNEIAQFKNIQAACLTDMEEMSSQHEVSRGEAPGRLDSSLSLAYLASKDEQSTIPKIRRLNRAREQAARMILSLYSQFVQEERLIKIGGESSEVEVMAFTGSDLKGMNDQLDYYDVRIRPSSTRPVNKAAQKSEIMTYMQAGILHPILDRKYIVRMLEIGDSKDFFKDERRDEARAKKEIEMIKAGEQVQPQFHEGHATHIETFVSYMKSEEWYDIDPKIQEAFVQHIAMHNQMVQEAMMATSPQGIEEQQGEGGPPTIGRKSQAGQAMMTDQGGTQRGQNISDMRGIYGGIGHE